MDDREAQLLDAARAGDTATLHWLLSEGVNVMHQTSTGCTALHWAARYDRSECARLLVAAGCPVDAQDNEGNTALLWCAQLGFINTVNVLLALGANPLSPNVCGITPLHVAVDPHVHSLISHAASAATGVPAESLSQQLRAQREHFEQQLQHQRQQQHRSFTGSRGSQGTSSSPSRSLSSLAHLRLALSGSLNNVTPPLSPAGVGHSDPSSSTSHSAQSLARTRQDVDAHHQGLFVSEHESYSAQQQRQIQQQQQQAPLVFSSFSQARAHATPATTTTTATTTNNNNTENNVIANAFDFSHHHHTLPTNQDTTPMNTGSASPLRLARAGSSNSADEMQVSSPPMGRSSLQRATDSLNTQPSSSSASSSSSSSSATTTLLSVVSATAPPLLPFAHDHSLSSLSSSASSASSFSRKRVLQRDNDESGVFGWTDADRLLSASPPRHEHQHHHHHHHHHQHHHHHEPYHSQPRQSHAHSPQQRSHSRLGAPAHSAHSHYHVAASSATTPITTAGLLTTAPPTTTTTTTTTAAAAAMGASFAQGPTAEIVSSDAKRVRNDSTSSSSSQLVAPLSSWPTFAQPQQR